LDESAPVTTVQELLDAAEVTDFDDLDDHLYARLDLDVWVVFEERPGPDGSTGILIRIAPVWQSLASRQDPDFVPGWLDEAFLSFPTTLAGLYRLVSRLDWKSIHQGEWEGLADDIAMLEGFAVRISNLPVDGVSWEDLDRPNEYPFKRAAPGNWSVAEWIEKRFRPRYPGFDVTVLGPESQARSNLSLKVLRQRWEESGNYPYST
jgi:hypothetical protein